ncbi:Sialin like protein [Argiope bruennichi]|uniref:Sialin like protein n=1 Tax=Argiope bruennichi TaxID=94029 RepID=A0A8T0F600_ARGBR|nr:Sialin like protein [Argiope bruennichi]
MESIHSGCDPGRLLLWLRFHTPARGSAVRAAGGQVASRRRNLFHILADVDHPYGGRLGNRCHGSFEGHCRSSTSGLPPTKEVVCCPSAQSVSTWAPSSLCRLAFSPYSTMWGGGWPSVFYLFGLIGCLWFVFWVFLVYNTPAEHPRISKAELVYIQQHLPQTSAERKSRPIPWGKIVRSRAVWAVTVAKFAGTWGFTCLLTKLPAYLADVLHFPIQKNGLINASVYTAEILAMFMSGCSSDYLRKKNWLSNTNIRKLFETFALLGPAFCLVLLPVMGCSHWPVVSLIIMSMFFYGMVGGGDIPAFVDIAPELAGTIFGLANGLAGTTGFLSPLIAGIFLDSDHGGMHQWSKVFYTSCGIYAFGAIFFLIFGSAEPEPWAVSEEPPASPGDLSRKASVRSDIEISLSIHASGSSTTWR